MSQSAKPIDYAQRFNAILNYFSNENKPVSFQFFDYFPSAECWRFFIDGCRQDKDEYFLKFNAILLKAMRFSYNAKQSHPNLYKQTTEVAQKNYSCMKQTIVSSGSPLRNAYRKHLSENDISEAEDAYLKIVAEYNKEYNDAPVSKLNLSPDIASHYNEYTLFIVDPEDFKLPIKEFISKHPIYMPHIEKMLRKFAKVNLYDNAKVDKIQNISLEKFIRRQSGWIPFELTEPGYLSAIFKAQKELMALLKSKKNKLTISLIKRIHQVSTNNVKNTNYQPNEDDKGGEFRKMPDNTNIYRSYGLVYTNASLVGLQEMIAKINSGTIPIKLHFESRHNPRESKVVDVKDANKIFNDYIAAENKDWILRTFGYIPETKSRLLKFFHIRPGEDKFFSGLLTSYIATYEKDMSLAKNPVDKLKSIITFIQNCEQAHVFYDGNCRTLCMSMFNFLLMANDFPPAILTDPNHFDCFSVDQLIEETLLGMERTIKISKGEKVFEISTLDIVKELLPDEKDYFEKTIQILDPQFKLELLEKQSKKPDDVKHAIPARPYASKW